MPKIAEATRAERRQHLIDAGWRCAATLGFNSLTVDDVCAAAGVSKGFFYSYFDQKQDLLFALLDDESAQFDSVLARVEASGVRGVDRLHRLMRAMLEWGKDPARQQIRSDIWSGLLSDPVLRKCFSKVMAGRRLALRRWIEEGVALGDLRDTPPNALAAILLALGDGLMMHAVLDPGAFRWTNVQRTVDALLEGVSG